MVVHEVALYPLASPVKCQLVALSREGDVLIILLQFASVVIIHAILNEDYRFLPERNGSAGLLIEPNARREAAFDQFLTVSTQK